MSEYEQTSTRRRMLTGGVATVGAAAGAVLLGAGNASAADGGAILAGRANTSTVTTALTVTSTSGGAHGLIVVGKNGYGFEGRSTANHGVSGVTTGEGKAGVLATHNGPSGENSAALIANGRKNVGARIYNHDSVQPALVVRSTNGNNGVGAGIAAEALQGVAVEGVGSVGVRAISDRNSALEATGHDNAVGADISGFSHDANIVPKAMQLMAIYPNIPFKTGTAIDALGDVKINGVLTKSSGTFKIDHPLDPANMYLSHSFVESPEMKNVYDGAVNADARGEAVVTMPDWFEALNKDLRYQLTAIGGPAPDLHVKKELADATFAIAGAKPGQKVCWQVTGTRKDAWANAHRVQVEQAKPKGERGTYLFPKGFDQPETKRLGYRKPAGKPTR